MVDAVGEEAQPDSPRPGQGQFIAPHTVDIDGELAKLDTDGYGPQDTRRRTRHSAVAPQGRLIYRSVCGNRRS